MLIRLTAYSEDTGETVEDVRTLSEDDLADADLMDRIATDLIKPLFENNDQREF